MLACYSRVWALPWTDLETHPAAQHDQSGLLAAPRLGRCTSSGRAWRLRAARRFQEEVRPLGSPQPPPTTISLPLTTMGPQRSLGCPREAAPWLALWCPFKVTDATAFGHPGGARRLPHGARKPHPAAAHPAAPRPHMWRLMAGYDGGVDRSRLVPGPRARERHRLAGYDGGAQRVCRRRARTPE